MWRIWWMSSISCKPVFPARLYSMIQKFFSLPVIISKEFLLYQFQQRQGKMKTVCTLFSAESKSFQKGFCFLAIFSIWSRLVPYCNLSYYGIGFVQPVCCICMAFQMPSSVWKGDAVYSGPHCPPLLYLPVLSWILPLYHQHPYFHSAIWADASFKTFCTPVSCSPVPVSGQFHCHQHPALSGQQHFSFDPHGVEMKRMNSLLSSIFSSSLWWI